MTGGPNEATEGPTMPEAAELDPERPASTSVAGASARAEFERQRDRHKTAMRALRPYFLAFGAVGLLFCLVGALLTPETPPMGAAFRVFWIAPAALVVGFTFAALFLLPNRVAAWGVGAEGEEKTARILAPLEAQGFRVIHDRLIPGSRTNIDHIVVGPPGVFVVETKNYAGRLRVRGGEVWVAGRRKTEMLAQAKREAAAVAAVVSPVPVTPLICVHRADLGWFKVEVEGIRIVGPRELVKLLRKAPATLTADRVANLADRIDRSLSPAVRAAREK